ncbi:hypothetical protein GCM10027346_16450 [Hymenobacter seoulensis]
MEELLHHELLDRATALFSAVGVGILHDEQLAAALDLTPPAFRELFGSKAAVLCLVTQRNTNRQRQEHEQLFAHLATPLECLLGLLNHSLQELRLAPNYDYHVVREQYPEAWKLMQDYINGYSFPLLTRLIEASVQEGYLRADLNPRLIAHILLSQFSMLLNDQLFPPAQTNLAEVYRNLFFPYVRGLCTEAGLQLAAHHFAKL